MIHRDLSTSGGWLFLTNYMILIRWLAGPTFK